MRIIATITACLALVGGAHAQEELMLVFGGPPASGTTVLYVNAESGTAPANATDTGTVVWNYTPSLAGTYSVSIPNNASSGSWRSVLTATETITGTAYGRLAIRPSGVSNGTEFFAALDASDNVLFLFLCGSAGGSAQIKDPDYGTRATGADGSFSSGGDRYVWWSYTAGGGTNAQVSIWVSDTKTKPGAATVSTTAGEGTGNFRKIQLRTSNFVRMTFDEIEVSTVDLGDFP